MAVLVALVILVFATRAVVGITYKAGVVEFAPNTLKPPTSPSQLILNNAHRYEEIIATAAKHNVDIVVFPECGLTSISIPAARQHILPYLTDLPIVGVNPCKLSNAPLVLKLLSCAAMKHRVYVVVNMDEVTHCSHEEQSDCPSDGKLFYNSNLAFDRDGTVVAKYRKFNLFVEPEFNTTAAAELAWFDTDFGVRFGTFICFDIMFREPALALLDKYNVSNIAYPTAWFSELPFLTAASVQAAWSYANDVNLLAAGYSNSPNKNFGSGVYAGVDGTVVAAMPTHSTTKLIIASLADQRGGVRPSHVEEITFTEDTATEPTFYHDDLANYTSLKVADRLTHMSYENEGFSCHVKLELKELAEEPVYRVLAYSGLRTYAGVRTVRIEVCGVVACGDSTLTSCSQRSSSTLTHNSVFTKLSISATSSNALVTFPITLDTSLLPLSSKVFQYKNVEKDNMFEINMNAIKPISNFVTFAVFRN